MSRTQATRDRIVSAARGALLSKSHWKYAEIRPIPIEAFNELLDGHGGTVTTDCSGLATCCYQRAGAPDPNGADYDTTKTMFTGTMISHLPAIPLAAAQVGDLAVFGAFPGKHVVIIVSTDADPECISHGGPGDPKIAPLSHFMPIGPLTVLRGVPRVPKPKSKAKWVISGDDGQVVGHVYTTKLRWWTRHRRVVKRQTEHLHFDRIHPEHPSTTNAPTHD
jgi:hypothetical protein